MLLAINQCGIIHKTNSYQAMYAIIHNEDVHILDTDDMVVQAIKGDELRELVVKDIIKVDNIFIDSYTYSISYNIYLYFFEENIQSRNIPFRYNKNKNSIEISKIVYNLSVGYDLAVRMNNKVLCHVIPFTTPKVLDCIVSYAFKLYNRLVVQTAIQLDYSCFYHFVLVYNLDGTFHTSFPISEFDNCFDYKTSEWGSSEDFKVRYRLLFKEKY